MFATHYQELIYFAHALEILLHTVVESRIDVESTLDSAADALLTKTVEFLDHFDVALDVVVGCARKTEMARWKWLFDVVGSPKTLFEARFFYFEFILETYLPAQLDLSLVRILEDCRLISSCITQS